MRKTRMAMVAVIAIAVSTALFLYAADVKIETYIQPSYMDLTEDSSGGAKNRFNESGPLFSAGIDTTFHFPENLSEKLEVEGFGGLINYKRGHALDLSNAFVETNFGKLGVTLKATTGYKVEISKDSYFFPFVVLGTSLWWRPIYSEVWLLGYGKLGALVELGKFFFEFGFLIPLFTQNNCFRQDLPWLNGGRFTDVVMYPNGFPTPFFGTGVRFERFNIGIFYETKEWERSGDVTAGDRCIYQPSTIYSLVGVRIGFPLGGYLR